MGNAVKTIEDSAFYNCYNLTSVALGNNVETIGDRAFNWCDLQSVEIPDSVITIGDSAFNSNEHLTSVTLGNSLETIGESAFAWCDLHSLTLPNSITAIGDEAFWGNESLDTVTRPKHDITIGEQAFGWTTYFGEDYMKSVQFEVTFIYTEESAPGGEKPTITISDDAKTAKVTGDFSTLYARVALALYNSGNGESGLFITQCMINTDGTIVVPAFEVPGLTVTGVNIALVKTIEDIISPSPKAVAMGYKLF